MNKIKPRFSEPVLFDVNEVSSRNMEPQEFDRFIKYAMDHIIEEGDNLDGIRPKQ